jgi:hypothetical protein
MQQKQMPAAAAADATTKADAAEVNAATPVTDDRKQ